MRILNQSPPAPFRESLKVAEQNLYSRSRELVGGRNPRDHELAVQMRAMVANKSGAQVGVPIVAALCPALLGKPLRGRMAVVGNVSLSGSIEPIHNPVDVVEPALAKGATYVLMPVACRKALADLSDEAAAKVQVLFYGDVGDASRKALAD